MAKPEQITAEIAIGQTVKYIRNKPDVKSGANEYEEGEGVVTAFFLNPDKRLMAQIKVGENLVNVDLACVDPSESAKAEFKEMVEAVDALTSEGNAAVKVIVDDYNARVQAAYTAFLGEPVSI